MSATNATPKQLRFIGNGSPCSRALHFDIEKIPTFVFEEADEASKEVAHEIASLIRAKQEAGEMCVLGLATGSTPTQIYSELLRMHLEEGLSCANLVTFNLDEYWPMQPEAMQSYHRFMNEHLFDLIDIDPSNVHVPDATIAPEEVRSYCDAYEKAIQDAGGIVEAV